jgi:hypothetical protein
VVFDSQTTITAAKTTGHVQISRTVETVKNPYPKKMDNMQAAMPNKTKAGLFFIEFYGRIQ